MLRGLPDIPPACGDIPQSPGVTPPAPWQRRSDREAARCSVRLSWPAARALAARARQIQNRCESIAGAWLRCSKKSRVGGLPSPAAAILRDAAKTPLLRMRASYVSLWYVVARSHGEEAPIGAVSNHDCSARIRRRKSSLLLDTAGLDQFRPLLFILVENLGVLLRAARRDLGAVGAQLLLHLVGSQRVPQGGIEFVDDRLRRTG